MRFRGKYDEAAQTRVRVNARVRNAEPSLTQQSAAADCDLNVIMKRFGADKSPIPQIPTDPRFYGDFDDQFTLREAMDRVHQAEDMFFQLPADLRAQFDNDPALMWEFVMDPANADQAVEMGILKRDEDPATAVSRPQGGVSQAPPAQGSPPVPVTPPAAS